MREIRGGRDTKRDNRSAEPTTDLAAVGRVRAAWRRLAPDGKDLTARRAELISVFERVLARDGLDKAEQVFQRIHIQLSVDRETPMIAELRRDSDQLVNNADGARKRLRQALAEVDRLHSMAAKHKWYGDWGTLSRVIVVPPRGAEPSDRRGSREQTGVPYSARRWLAARAVYQVAFETLDRDPLFLLLLSRPFTAGPRGNPDKRRNKLLRTELHALGLARPEISNILSAIKFTSGR